MTRLVFVCTTCDRHARPRVPVTAGKRLAEAFARYLGKNAGHGLEIRQVACLNGCLKPCNVAFRGQNRATVRFSRIVETDIPRLARFGALYWAAAERASIDAAAAQELSAKLSLNVPPTRAAPGGAAEVTGSNT